MLCNNCFIVDTIITTRDSTDFSLRIYHIRAIFVSSFLLFISNKTRNIHDYAGAYKSR